MSQLLNDPEQQIYHRVDDPVYDEFRQNIRERESFLNNISDIELNDRVRIWRTNRDIEKNCKEKMLKIEQREKAKKEKVSRLLCCRCLKKPKLNETQKRFEWLRNRTRRILKKKSRDDNFFRTDGSKQGMQGELETYTLRTNLEFNRKQTLSQNLVFALQTLMFAAIFLYGAKTIIENFRPNIWNETLDEWKALSKSAAHDAVDFAYSLTVFVLNMPENVYKLITKAQG
uniref:Uncharacterized protein n=1 Tax=Strombidium rassoulzadegani TaxID=1082188 RepID=A0A7S3CSK2_9SPIT|mmetsp:Transcript_7056/g.11879  ORF Transcript_7056/g.11879 Transcript_7056/m.11879 type:complete len:229 (+) Transcript_7056:160-846(+)